MSSTWEPEFSLPDHEILEGLASHGFEARNHGREDGLDLEDYLQKSSDVINAPEVVFSLEQHGSVNTFYGNDDLEGVVIVNGNDPARSTSFNPTGPGGVTGYFERALERKANSNPEILLNDLIVDNDDNLIPTGPYIASDAEELSATEETEAVEDSVDSIEGDWL